MKSFKFKNNMFRSEINIETKPDFFINHKSKIISIGSCFAENIGAKLKRHKFDTEVNPFGTIYNPVSIAELIQLAATNAPLAEDSYTQNNEIYSHYLLHSDHSSTDLAELKKNINSLFISLNKSIKTADLLIVTLGSSYVYELKKSKQIVANCHKSPSLLFDKRILSLEEIEAALKIIRSSIPESTKIIYSLSPVRHIKEGLENNSLSKSLLRVGIENHIQKYENTCYFPSYEILMDDLRDYRFYQEDLIHPSPMAVDYIWKLFQETFMDPEVMTLNKQINKLIKSAEHRAFSSETTQHQNFIKATTKKMKELGIIDFSEEILKLEKELK